MPVIPASDLGLATFQILEKIGDRNTDVRLLVVDPIEAVTLEQRDNFLGGTFADDDVAADIEQDVTQSYIDEPLAEIHAPVLSLAIERRHKYGVRIGFERGLTKMLGANAEPEV